MRPLAAAAITVAIAVQGCRNGAHRQEAGGGTQEAIAPARDCAPGNGGLTLPDGFCATVFADSLGHARHMAVAPNGVVYVNTWSGKYYGNDKPHAGGFLVALRDTTDDGRADQIVRFGDSVESGGAGGTGIAVYHGHVYAEEKDKILKYPLGDGLAPSGGPEIVVRGLPLTGDHPMHPFAIDSAGGLYVDLGSATNACQIKNRIAGSPGHRPCTELETRGGIWRYDANRTGQRFSPAERYATGIRNADGIAVDASGKVVYATQHGRDQLFENWPKLYSQAEGASQPAEELLVIERGGEYGWPECYFDTVAQKLVLAPEYGGDGGKAIGPCAGKKGPLAWYPAHWAPLALALTSGRQFPSGYAGGIFIAFHGSWNRAPAPQQGYNVVFQPMEGGKPSGKYEIFADGFAGGMKDPGLAEHRPAGVAFGPDGSLYISDDVRGRIWRVSYRGEAATASRTRAESTSVPAVSHGAPQAKPAMPPEGINPSAGESPVVAQGDSVFHGLAGGATCVGCHGADAKGTPLGPDLTDSQWLWSDGSLAGIEATIVKGVPAPKQHTGVMPPMGGANLTKAQVHAVAAYVYALSGGGSGSAKR
jgi:glucose/arabinose dehydrogenase/mono/diheme cytochrome c family protein